MKLLSLFSGIGAFEKALDRLKKQYQLVNYCEIDKYASKAYSQIHECDESLNLGDITKIDTSTLPNDIDLITYGFPCQDISLAGKQKGFEADGERTRSGLFFEALRIIEDAKPRIAIAENVKNLTSKKFQKEFDIVLSSLEQAGYNNYWKVLNAKDYGIPQNRERVFIVSIRKDIDNGMFKFPKPFELKLRLKDMLEDEVDEKYYLGNEKIQKIKNSNFMQEKTIIQKSDVCSTLLARDYKDPKCVEVNAVIKYGIFDDEKGKHQAGSVWDKEGLAPTLDTMQGGHRQPCIEVKEATKKGYAEAHEGDSINLEQLNSKTRRGRVGKGVAQTLTTSCNQAIVEPMICASRGRNPDNPSSRVAGEPTEQRIEVNTKGLCNTLTTVQKDNLVLEPQVIIGSTQKHAAINYEGICPTLTSAMGTGGGNVPMHNYELRIRKLTPKECWRLMGFSDEDFYKVKGISNSQLYKMAGNSIVVDVLVHLFKSLFTALESDEHAEIIEQPMLFEIKKEEVKENILDTKITNAMHRIEELYYETDGKCYLSFSGGKDSTVILAIIKMCEEIYTIPPNAIPAVFIDTGIELGATKDFVRLVKENWYSNIEIIRPEKSFANVIKEYGKPIKSKMKSDFISRYQKNRNEDQLSFQYMIGVGKNGKHYDKIKIANKDLHLLHHDFDIKISNKCCEILKKKPFKKYNKEHNIKGYILGERMAEGGARQLNGEKRIKNGDKLCTKTKGKYIVKLPIIDWTDEDIDNFIKQYIVPLSKAYTEQGYERTGCFLCPYSLQLANNLEKLYQYEPNRYKAAMFWLKDVYIAQNVILPFDAEYEKERKEKWHKDYERMRYEMLKKYRPNVAEKYSDYQSDIFDFL